MLTRCVATGLRRGLSSCRPGYRPRTAMSLFMDIGRAPAWPARPACGRSCRRCSPARWRAATWGSTSTAPTGSFLESPGFLLAVLGAGRARVPGRTLGRRTVGRWSGSATAAVIGVVLGALLFAGALADGGSRGLAGPDRRAALRAARLAGRRAAWWSGRARRLDGGAAALLTVYADGAALLLAAGRDLRAAGLVPRARRLRGAPARAAAARGREVRRACGSCGRWPDGKKLVLAVIDSLKPDMLDQAIEEGRAPALAALLRARHLRARLRLHLPVGDPGGVAPRSPPAAARASTTSRR